jgi:hypothetical protein
MGRTLLGGEISLLNDLPDLTVYSLVHDYFDPIDADYPLLHASSGVYRYAALTPPFWRQRPLRRAQGLQWSIQQIHVEHPPQSIQIQREELR